MANVCVITGGGSGMGLEAAKFMPKDKIIVISGRTMSKLEGAVAQLKELGYDRYIIIEREISGDKQTEDVLKAKKYFEDMLKALKF